MLRSLLRRWVRADAGKFWLRLLGSAVTSIAFAVAVGLVTGIALIVAGADAGTQDVVMAGSGALVGLQVILSQLRIAVERCRAVGRSGWWSLLLLVPLVGPALLLADLTFRPFAAERPAS